MDSLVFLKNVSWVRQAPMADSPSIGFCNELLIAAKYDGTEMFQVGVYRFVCV